MDGDYYHISTDVLARVMTFSTVPDAPVGNIKLTVSKVREIMSINRSGRKVDTIVGEVGVAEPEITFASGSEEDSITRFDRSKRKKNRKKGNNRQNEGGEPKSQQPRETKESQGDAAQHTGGNRGDRRHGGRNRGFHRHSREGRQGENNHSNTKNGGEQ